MIARKIVVLGTGGTLAGTAASASDNVGYRAAQVGIEQLVRAVPSIAHWPIETEQVAQVDSKDMTPEIWRDLAVRCAHHLSRDDVSGLVVTHGTDTLEETAFFLQEVLCPAKPVVLTCAMRPSTSIAADGPQNIADAFAVAATPGARGVVAVCAGVVHHARDVRKVHHYRADPFSSGDAGPLGYVEEGAVRRVREWPGGDADAAHARLQRFTTAASWPDVAIVTSHAGSRPYEVDALVGAGVRGLVIAATGNGTIHGALLEPLARAQARGVKVVRVSRCAFGGVIGSAHESIAASDLTPVKARIALMLELLA